MSLFYISNNLLVMFKAIRPTKSDIMFSAKVQSAVRIQRTLREEAHNGWNPNAHNINQGKNTCRLMSEYLPFCESHENLKESGMDDSCDLPVYLLLPTGRGSGTKLILLAPIKNFISSDTSLRCSPTVHKKWSRFLTQTVHNTNFRQGPILHHSNK